MLYFHLVRNTLLALGSFLILALMLFFISKPAKLGSTEFEMQKLTDPVLILDTSQIDMSPHNDALTALEEYKAKGYKIFRFDLKFSEEEGIFAVLGMGGGVGLT